MQPHLSLKKINKSINRHMTFHKATEQDLPSIIEMIADDELGQVRENFQMPLPKEYFQAF